MPKATELELSYINRNFNIRKVTIELLLKRTFVKN